MSRAIIKLDGHPGTAVPPIPETWVDPKDVTPAEPSSAPLPPIAPPRAEADPQSASRILLGHKAHGRRRLALLAVLARLRNGQSVVWATTAPGETQEKLRALLAAEGATASDLARFTVWNPEDGE